MKNPYHEGVMGNNSLVECISYKTLTDLILKAKTRIIISLPGIHPEIQHALTEASKKINDIKVIVDISEETIRNGYGEIEPIRKLREQKVKVYDNPNNIVSFIICDDTGYYLFPQSRIFAFEETGTNAVRIDPLSIVVLLAYFFPPQGQEDVKTLQEARQRAMELLAKSDLTNVSAIRSSPIKEAEKEKVEEITKKLDSNPPLHPDLQRQMKTYTALVQFVEFHFEGKNIQSAKIKIPAEALPFKDESIRKRLETKMKLFDDIEDDEHYKPLKDVKQKIEEVRKEYLTPIGSRDKSLIRTDRKLEFQKKIDELKKQLELKRHDIIGWLTSELLDSGDRLKSELVEFLKNNPPKEYEQLRTNVELFARKTDSIATRIVSHIEIPEPEKLIDKMNITVNYYDLTWDDFRNRDFLAELEEKGVFEKGAIEQIVQMKDAYEVKRDEKQSS